MHGCQGPCGGGVGAAVCDTERDVCSQMHFYVAGSICFTVDGLNGREEVLLRLESLPKVAQSVPEQDAGSRSAQMQLFLSDLNHFHS